MSFEGILFTIVAPEDTTIGDDEIAVFTGVGLPGKTVTVTIGGNNVNNTVVGEDSTWSLGIPASRIDGSAIPVFRYAGEEFDSTVISVSGSSEGGMEFGLSLIHI